MVREMADIRVHGYARVSSKEQNEARQLKALREQGIADRDIYLDTLSGKSFERPEYKRLLNVLRKGDLVIILSIDRLGRNYSEVQEQWKYITQDIGANIKVIDMPLLDTSANSNNLDNTFIADLVLQILSYVAEKERQNIRQRQRQGIDSMPVINGKKVSTKTGLPIGRPRAEHPDNWNEVYTDWKDKKITAVNAMQILALKPNTFYKFIQEEKQKK